MMAVKNLSLPTRAAVFLFAALAMTVPLGAAEEFPLFPAGDSTPSGKGVNPIDDQAGQPASVSGPISETAGDNDIWTAIDALDPANLELKTMSGPESEQAIAQMRKQIETAMPPAALGEHYHGTSLDNLKGIISDGVMKKFDGSAKDVYVETIEPKSALTKPKAALYYAELRSQENKSAPVLLRIRGRWRSPLMFKTEFFGRTYNERRQVISHGKVRLENIEVFLPSSSKWISLRKLREKKQPHVVIVGGGFGGLYAAYALNRRPVRVTLVDRQNDHLFQPLLYQVATAALSPGDIAQPIRRLLRKSPNIQVRLGEAASADLKNRTLKVGDETVAYDYLVIAAGARSAYYGHPEWGQFAPSLKGMDDALVMRRRVLEAFAAAGREKDPARRETLLTFVVIGGGPTGVELAGGISELARSPRSGLSAEELRQVRIVLLEAGPRILPILDSDSGEAAKAALAERGVEVRTNEPVTNIGEEQVETAKGSIAAGNIFWTAGVEASPLAKTLGVPLDSSGRVRVENDLTVPGHPEVTVIGDMASFIQDGKPLPGLAPVAIQMGRHAAGNILRAVKGLPPLVFHYIDKGLIAVIGRRAAIGRIGSRQVSGTPAWAAWLLIHLFFLIGLRNRLSVLLKWSGLKRGTK